MRRRVLAVAAGLLLLPLVLVATPSPAVAAAGTTPYRSAGWVATDGTTPYADTAGCQATGDGRYCVRSSATGYANLYFSSFGTLADYGIPAGSQITRVRIRVTGGASGGLYVSINSGRNLMPFAGQCQFPSDIWRIWATSPDHVSSFANFTIGDHIGNGCVTAERRRAETDHPAQSLL